MDLHKTYEIEQAKWDSVASAKALKESFVLPPGEDFFRFSSRTSTHVGVNDFLGDLQGKSVLEFGCGLGHMSALLARSGAQVTAFDLSNESVRVAKMRAEVNQLSSSVQQLVCAGEALPFASESFDILFGKAILHHLSAQYAQADLYRVLKPGGKAVFIEPMGMNPLLVYARDHLPYPGKNPRGADRPLNYDDIHAWGNSFKQFTYREVQLVSMLRRGLGIKKNIQVFTRLDDFLLKRFPFLRRYCRYVVLYMVK